MKYIFSALTLFQLFSLSTNAQDIAYDTFIRKDGLYPPVEMAERVPSTFFIAKNAKGKEIATPNLMDASVADKIRHYYALSASQQEPGNYFRALRDLEAHDSAAYFDGLQSMPVNYQQFFNGLFLVEQNRFGSAVPVFSGLLAGTDSFLIRESGFWIAAADALQNDLVQFNTLLSAYNAPDNNTVAGYNVVAGKLDAVNLPAYRFHKFLTLYNRSYRSRQYDLARSFYDSVLAYTSHAKMKTSLGRNRAAVTEMLEANHKFTSVVKKKLYYYELEYLFDHLQAWGKEFVTDRDLVEDAGFVLHQKLTNNTDTVYTRYLKDTAEAEDLTKFEALTFSRTKLEQGRRFVIVKLACNHEATYKYYLSLVERFRNKPVQQSVLQTGNSRVAGNEYLLTQHFVAALYEHQDPIARYVVCLYFLEDKDGNIFAVDTLF